MAVRKLKGSWWVDFTTNRRRHRIRSPENTRRGAVVYETTLRRELANGGSIDDKREADRGVLFEQFAEKWFAEYVVPNNKYSEQRTKHYLLSATLIPFFGKLPIADITVRHIDQYKAAAVRNGVKNKTLKNRLTVLNRLLITAYEWLALPGSPPKIKWPKCASFRTDYLSADECELLIARSDGVVGELILTALRTGMRQGELKGLQWSSIDWQNRSVAIRHSRCDYQKALGPTKNNRERHVPLDIDVYDALYQRKRSTGYVFLDDDGQPFDHKRLARRLTSVCKKAGLRPITSHILRHTFATHLAMRGVPLNVVQQLLGHASITTTSRYAHVAPSTLRTAIEMLNPKTLLNDDLGQPAVNPWVRMQQLEMVEKKTVSENGSVGR